MNNLTKKQKTIRLVETAIMIALSTILAEFTVIKFPYGGSVTIFSQVPMVVISYRYGVKWGLFAGLSMGIIQMLFGMENFSYVSGLPAYLVLILADYIIAFGSLGLGGMFRNIFGKNGVKGSIISLTLGGAVVSVIRFLCHFISGVTIWGDYSGGAKSVWMYSLTYNAGYMIPELIITVIGCVAIASIFNISSQEIRVRKLK